MNINMQFVKFIIVGVLNTIFGYCIYWTLLRMGLNFTLAILFSTLIGVIFNFKTYGRLVFKNEGNSLLSKFVLVYLLLYFLNVFGVMLLHRFGIDYELSGFLMILPSAFVGFTLNRKFVFLNHHEN
jgi:putative flippase GtrA